ncbi:hypothetical protein KAH85_05775 [Candidatus Bathyarchaeota archaeon]|nr:hypothetical protein [Candidatus Bathyarchaeota archaeon]
MVKSNETAERWRKDRERIPRKKGIMLLALLAILIVKNPRIIRPTCKNKIDLGAGLQLQYSGRRLARIPTKS